MQHCSTKTYQQPSSKHQEKKIKEVGSIFEQPLIEQIVSTKNASMRHVFRSNSVEPGNGENILSVMNNFPTTMKIYNIEHLGDKIRKTFRKHIRIDIKEYLKRKYNKPTFLLPLESFESLRTLDAKKPVYDRTNGIILYKPYVLNGNIKLLLDKNPNEVKELPLHNILI